MPLCEVYIKNIWQYIYQLAFITINYHQYFLMCTVCWLDFIRHLLSHLHVTRIYKMLYLTMLCSGWSYMLLRKRWETSNSILNERVRLIWALHVAWRVHSDSLSVWSRTLASLGNISINDNAFHDLTIFCILLCLLDVLFTRACHAVNFFLSATGIEWFVYIT